MLKDEIKALEDSGVDLSNIKSAIRYLHSTIYKLIQEHIVEDCITCVHSHSGYSKMYDCIVDTCCDFKPRCVNGFGSEKLWQHPIMKDLEKYKLEEV